MLEFRPEGASTGDIPHFCEDCGAIWVMWRHSSVLCPGCGRASVRYLTPLEFVALLEHCMATDGVRQIVDPTGDTEATRAGIAGIFRGIAIALPDLRRSAEEEEGLGGYGG